MKKNDIAMIIIIASISVVVAYFTAKFIFGDAYSGKATIKTIDKIESSVVEPSTDVFNKDAINPTIQVNVTGTDTSSNSSNAGN